MGWQAALVALTITVADIVAVGHIVLTKQNDRSAVAWAGLVLLAPGIGALLYLVFGVNRIRRRAVSLRAGLPSHRATEVDVHAIEPDAWRAHAPDGCGHLGPLVHLVGSLSDRALLRGNAVEPLVNGDAAYPAMIAAIDAAERCVGLSSYIFNADRVGLRFVDALARAHERGVVVRVLVDAVGERYGWPRRIVSHLRARDVSAARFLPALAPWNIAFLNLRNHRKILVVDGCVGFTGGMNLKQGHVLDDEPKHPVRDLHFRLEGPIVAQLTEAFAIDWEFATSERLATDPWFPEVAEVGPVAARGVSDGPDETRERLERVLLGAVSVARERVRIMTPYFVPDEPLMWALETAARRGVEIDLVLPGANNFAFMTWAAMRRVERLIAHGARVTFSLPPFDHSKVMVVDGAWTLIGSGNWDARSLSLNFEFNVEVYDAAFACAVEQLVLERRDAGQTVDAARLAKRGVLVRVRDGLVRLASPYL